MITARAIEAVLLPLVIYGAMPRSLLQKLPPWNTASDRTLRRSLAKLKAENLVANIRPHFVLLKAAKPTPLWFITDAGRAALTAATGDEAFRKRTPLPPRHLLEHHLGVVEFHIDFSRAIQGQDTYRIAGWISEWDAIGEGASNGRSRHLYTEFSRKPRLVCAPDFALLLERRGGAAEPARTKCYLGEFDRHTTQSAKRIATDKAPGYSELKRRSGHRRFFPDQGVTEDAFKVVIVTTGSARWRDDLRRAFAKGSHPELYVFACREDLTPETLLRAAVFYPTGDGEPKPLVRAPEPEVIHG